MEAVSEGEGRQWSFFLATLLIFGKVTGDKIFVSRPEIVRTER